MKHFSLAVIAGAILLGGAALTQPAQAQLFDRPRGDIPRGEAPGNNSGAQAVRIDRLENQIRSLIGQIEELQHQLRRMEDQLRKFQGDVDFRFQQREDGGGAARPGRRSEAPAPQGNAPREAVPESPPAGGPMVAGNEPATGAPPAGRRRGDAFDPQAQPEAPGAPRQLGSAVPSQPLDNPPRTAGGRDLPSGPLGSDQPGTDRDADDPNAPVDLGRPGPVASVRPPVEPGAAQAPATPRQQFDLAAAAMKERRYDDAGRDFEAFIATHPKNGLVPEATFQLGLSFERRNRHREAAEYYLKVATDYSKARRAAESMLRLGITLERLGAQEQACATYQEASRKYPLAPAYVRTGLERQIQRAKC